jgi:hypothetical protein
MTVVRHLSRILGCPECSKHHSVCDCPASVQRARALTWVDDDDALLGSFRCDELPVDEAAS